MRALILVVGAFLFSIRPSFADSLIVISSGGGMYGDEKANKAVEQVGLNFVTSALQSKYDHVFTWKEHGTISDRRQWLSGLVKGLGPNEKYDIFSMQHGHETFFPGMTQEEIEKIFPKNSIRSVYSTGCSQWGDFRAKADGTLIDFSKNSYAAHLKRLGVQEYVAHANTNATGPASLALLVGQLRKERSWIKAGKQAFDQVDAVSEKALIKVKKLEPALQKLTKSDEPSRELENALEMYFGSRPVLGGDKFSENAPLFAGRNMLPSPSEAAMLAPSEPLKKALASEVPKAFDDPKISGPEYFNCKDGICLLKPSLQSSEAQASVAQGVMGIASFFQSLFAAYSEKGDGCLDPLIVAPLIATYLHTKDGRPPTLEKFCAKRYSKNLYEISWKLGPTPDAKLMARAGIYVDPGQDFWEVQLPKDTKNSTDTHEKSGSPQPKEVSDQNDGPKLKSFSLDREGTIALSTNGFKTELSVKGVGVNLTKVPHVPDALLHAYVRGVAIDESGTVSVNAGAPLFAIPVGIDAKVKSMDRADPTRVRVLGIPFRLDDQDDAPSGPYDPAFSDPVSSTGA